MSGRIVTFGEVMGRIGPREFQRFPQALPGVVDFTFGGAEANVAASLAVLGADTAFVTVLPRNSVADACVMALRKLGVDVSGIVRTDFGRFGLYYVEPGANQRPSHVTYDRDGSAFVTADPAVYDWERLFAGASGFHFTGITPATGERPAQALRQALEVAHRHRLTVSCDLNYRSKLWRWAPASAPRELARQTLRELMPFVDLVIANEEDADNMLGIRAADTDVEAGRLNIEGYLEVARRICEEFDNVKRVGITLRESVSATHNNWGAVLYERDRDRAWFAPTDSRGAYTPYAIHAIVDRVGAGDAFAAGLLYSLAERDLQEPERAIRFAAAASCLKHSIPADFNYATRADVEALMTGGGTGRVRR
ncbi:MAG: sugar kinase [Kiritimatiellaeota bacterium]|nr:sugar kinase [Kiritimatiellota bacterium]